MTRKMQTFLLTLAIACLATPSLFGFNWYWRLFDGSASGNYDATNNWSKMTASDQPTVMRPFAANDAAYVGYNYPYLDIEVTFPSGTYTNYAKFAPTLCNLQAKYKTLTLNGTNTVFRHPLNETGANYNQTPFQIAALNSTAYRLVELDRSILTTQLPNFEFSNFRFFGRHLDDRNVTLTFERGTYNFYNPCGTARTDSLRPFLRFFDFGHAFGSPTSAPELDSAEIVFEPGTSLQVGVMAVNAHAVTNVLRFTGGTHEAKYLYAPFKIDGQAVNTTAATVADLVVESNATFTVATQATLGYETTAANQRIRLIARDGGTIAFGGTVEQKSGDDPVIADGGTVRFDADNNLSNLVVRADGILDAQKELYVKGTLDIEGGTVKLMNGTTSRLMAGRNYGEKGVINMTGGVITNNAATQYSLTIGYAGVGEFNLSGGTVYAAIVRMGASSSGSTAYADADVFRQTGGTFVCQSISGGQNTFTVSHNSLRTGYVYLNGGVLKTRLIEKGTNGKAAYLEANGGTLEVIGERTDVIRNFTAARLGPQGLTFRATTDDCGLSQTFVDQDGVSGRLILEGDSRTITLGGDQSGLSVVEVKSGSAVLSATGLNTVAVSGGALKLTAGTPLGVQTFAFGANGGLALSGTITAGTTYTLVQAANAIDADSQAALVAAAAAGRVTGLPTDTSASFTFTDNAVKMEVIDPHRAVTIDVPAATTQTDSQTLTCSTLTTSVGKGSKLTLNGTYSVETLAKEGLGKITIPDTTKLSADALTMASGVLEVTGPAAGAQITAPFTMTQTSTNDIVIVKNTVPLEMNCPNGPGTTGEFVKRGPATLTLDVSGSQTLTGGNGYSRLGNGSLWQWNQINIGQLTFDTTSDMVTTSGVPPFLVAEGALVLKGQTDDAKAIVKGSAAVGTSTQVGTAQPGLVLDHVALEVNTYPTYYFNLGIGIDCSDSSAPRTGDVMFAPYLTLTNGASLLTGDFEMGKFCYHKDMDVRLVVDGSTFRARNGVTVGMGSSLEFRNGAQLIAPDFAKGGQLYLKAPATVVFDNASWQPEALTKDFTIGAVTNIAYSVRNTGLKLEVPADRTWTVSTPISGTGGLVKSGAGTLVFATNQTYTGATVVKAGTLQRLSCGTVKLSLDIDASGAVAAVPTLKDVTADVCYVDFGRTAENPIDLDSISNLVVANLAGTTSLTKFSLLGTGHVGARGNFTIQDGQLILKSTRIAPGSMLILE